MHTSIQTGYPFKLHSRRIRGDLTVFSYRFYSPKANSTFIIQAFYHEQISLFMLKFYNLTHKSKNKYAILTGKGDVRRILQTNFDVMIQLLGAFPQASFGFMGERSYFKDRADHQTLIEPMENNQRFRVYKLFIQNPGIQHRIQPLFLQAYINIVSSYLLLNKSNKQFGSLTAYGHKVRSFLGSKYPTLNFTDL